MDDKRDAAPYYLTNRHSPIWVERRVNSCFCSLTLAKGPIRRNTISVFPFLKKRSISARLLRRASVHEYRIVRVGLPKI